MRAKFLPFAANSPIRADDRSAKTGRGEFSGPLPAAYEPGDTHVSAIRSPNLPSLSHFVAPVAAAMLLVAAAAAPALAARTLGHEVVSGGVAGLREHCEWP